MSSRRLRRGRRSRSCSSPGTDEKENYLVTINATLESEDELPSQTMPLSEVMKALGDTQATVKLAVLDCCRNNPFATKSWHKTKDIVRDQVLRQLRRGHQSPVWHCALLLHRSRSGARGQELPHP